MRPPWHTPSSLSLDEAARASLRAGRALHERRVLAAAIRDPQLGVCPLPIRLLVEILDCIGGVTGVGYPGLEWLRAEVERHNAGLQTRLSPGGIRNAAALLAACGHVVSKRHASPESNGRAVAHFAATLPSEAEREAAIVAYLASPEARRHRRPDVMPRMTSPGSASEPRGACGQPDPDVIATMTSGGLMSSQTGADVIALHARASGT